MTLRVAHAYDRNRSHPPEVSGRIATAITEPVERAFKEPSLLEVGVGTGRIAMPIVARGFKFTGIDTDPSMMQLFRSKYGGVSRKVSLLEADAQDLPFEDGAFHAVIAVHVWQLVPDLSRAIDEALRVLRPGGFLFEGWDAPQGGAELEIQERWREALRLRGTEMQRGGHHAALEAAKQHLQAHGLDSQQSVIAKWEIEHSPLEVLEALTDGLHSFTRSVAPELRLQATRDIQPWVEERYPNLETPIKTPWAFHLRSTRLPRL